MTLEEMISIIEANSSQNMTEDACKRQAERIVDALSTTQSAAPGGEGVGKIQEGNAMKRPYMPTMSMAANKDDLALQTAEQLWSALALIEKMLADLLECREYFLDHCDIVDGDDGEPAPNKEMRLYRMIGDTLYGPAGYR